MKKNISKRIVVIFIIGLFTLACSLLNLGDVEVPAGASTQSADPIEEIPNDATATNTNEAVTPQAETATVYEIATPSNDVDTSVPDGTYIGTTTLPEDWDNYSQGLWEESTIEENEIMIIISPYGDVSGGVIFVLKGEPVSVPGESCIFTVNLYSTATLSGNLTETGGTIDIADELTSEVLSSGCPYDSYTTFSTNTYQAQVSIIDNQIIIGEVPGYYLGTYSFKATKR